MDIYGATARVIQQMGIIKLFFEIIGTRYNQADDMAKYISRSGHAGRVESARMRTRLTRLARQEGVRRKATT